MTLLKLAALILVLLPGLASAGEFIPLVGIPGIEDPSADFNTYINALYTLSISIAALIAVIKIIVAGAKYMLDDTGVGSKTAAKEDIRNALVGLLIIVGAWIILNTVNSNLTSFAIFDAGDQITIADEGQRWGEESGMAAARELCGAGGCERVTCSWLDTREAFLPDHSERGVNPCQSMCEAVGNSVYIDPPRGVSRGDCMLSTARREEVFDEPLAAIVDRRCPTGNCTIEICTSDPSSYCERGDNLTTVTARGACENLGGTFVENYRACVLPR